MEQNFSSRSTRKFLSHMNTTFPLSGKTFCLRFTKSCHSGKLYPVSGIKFLHMNRTKLFDSSKCFLANRDNFCPYEQALKVLSNELENFLLPFNIEITHQKSTARRMYERTCTSFKNSFTYNKNFLCI